MTDVSAPAPNFIRDIIKEDLASGRVKSVVTRFPPEPNGYLHIGHAKAISIDFGLAAEFGGRCHLRFDDTNPTKEDQEYIDAIIRDVRWLGWDWGTNLFYASDYFDTMYEYALYLIKHGKAYVDELDPEQIREYRGTLTTAGKISPYRNRPVEENLELFERMRKGEFEEGSMVLRAKIDMASPNINMRDPVLYRIIKKPHHRSGSKWQIYPMYDFAHPIEDAIEGVTHSLCSLEFEDHRPLYDWIIENCPVPCKPKQIEFARLNMTYTVMSKRKLLRLVQQGLVDGWDDPRMPTISGMRRRGYTPEAIRNFTERIGVAKRESVVDIAMLEYCVREHLNKIAPRYMAVLDPLKVIIDNYPQDKEEELEAVNNPEDASMGTRKVPFCRELYIERADFMEEPPKKFYRLAPGREVRLRWAYFITCNYVEKDSNGRIVAIHCTYDPATRGGDASDGRKVKATLHWVSAKHAFDVEVRLYSTLFNKENPEETAADGEDFTSNINPESLKIIKNCKCEPALRFLAAGDRFQLERLGYFCVDTKYTTSSKLVFNRTVTLKDEWARIIKREHDTI